MTIVWIGLIVLGIILVIAAFTVGDWLPFTDGPAYLCAGGVIVCLAGIICFFAVPVHGYMEVESTHWQWTVDIYTYSAVNKSGKTNEKVTGRIASATAEDAIPENAYNVKIDVCSVSHDNGTYYYAKYSYTIDEWIKTSEVSVCGRDKNPYEPERPFDTTAPDVLGNQKCGMGHNELYTVTGLVDDEMHTYNISRSDWERINENDEFGYKKYRFGDTIWDLQIAQ